MREKTPRLAIAALVALAATPTLAGRNERPEPYTLSDPLKLESDEQYGVPDDNPAHRRGLVLHGYTYDAMEPLDWQNQDLAREAQERCGDSFDISELTRRSGHPDATVRSEFWLVHSGSEALHIRRSYGHVAVRGCKARPVYSLSVRRVLFAEDRVTVFTMIDGRTAQIETVPLDSSSYPGDEFISGRGPTVRQHDRRWSYRPDRPHPLGVRVLCYDTSSHFDRGYHCRLDESGRWRGLLLESHAEHTATYEHGMRVDFLLRDAVIDGRLFEWDRSIELVERAAAEIEAGTVASMDTLHGKAA